MTNLNRRQFVGCAGTLPCISGAQAKGADRPRSYGADYPGMLLAFLGGRLNALAQQWDQVRSKIKCAAEVEERNRFVREKVREMIHGLPARSELKPVTAATLERDGYRIENVMFQSRPDFWVTGNLYVPKGSGPFPAVISPCGHYPRARMEPEYQFAYLSLVHSGFVVLAYDPIGQGERRQYWNPRTRETEVASSSTYEHSMPGQVLLMMGEDLTHYRVWDGMRAIDYLLTRPEVDGKRIGCAGHSGGGTLTKFIAAIDERVQCAVINEGGTSNRWPVRFPPGSRVGPSDVEQNLFPAALYGIDNPDVHAAIAPRPLLVLIEDYSPAFDAAAEHVRTRYRQLGVPEKFSTEEATDPHSWTFKLRLASTGWFCRWFQGRGGPEREPDFRPEPEELLYCSPNGSIRYAQQGETIFSLMLKKQHQLPPKRQPPRDAAELDAFRSDLRRKVTDLLRYKKSDHPLAVRHLVTTPRRGYRVEKVEFLSEPGIYVPAWVFVPEQRARQASPILWVNEAGKEADGVEFGSLEALARKGQLAIAFDVRGVGETRPQHASERSDGFSHLFDADTAMTYMAWYLDQSLFGMRVHDVVRSVDYALSRPDAGHGGLRVIGKGAGALWALFAATLDARITSVIAQQGLLTYSSLATGDRYLHGAHIFLRDVLLSFDLPQVAGAVAGRRLILLSPVDPMKNPVPLAAARRAYQWTQQAYSAAGAAGQFEIVPGPADAELYGKLLA